MRTHARGRPVRLNDGDEHGRVIIRISAQSAAMPGGGRGPCIYEGYILIARINSRGYRGRNVESGGTVGGERRRNRYENKPVRAAQRRAGPRSRIRSVAGFYLLPARRFIKN